MWLVLFWMLHGILELEILFLPPFADGELRGLGTLTQSSVLEYSVLYSPNTASHTGGWCSENGHYFPATFGLAVSLSCFSIKHSDAFFLWEICIL